MAVCDRKGSGRWVEVGGFTMLSSRDFPQAVALAPTYVPTYGIVELIQVVCHDWRRAQRVSRVGR